MVEDKYLVHPYLEYCMKFRFPPSLEGPYNDQRCQLFMYEDRLMG